MDKSQQKIIEYELTTIYTTRDHSQVIPTTPNKLHNSDCIITINAFEHQKNTRENFNQNTSYLYQNISLMQSQPIAEEKIINNNEHTQLSLTDNTKDNTPTTKKLKQFGAAACGLIVTFGIFIGSITFTILTDPCFKNTTLHCLD
jgi:hypothetical protein